VSRFRSTSPAPTETASRGTLAVELAGARVYEDVTVPRTTANGRMRLLSRGETRSVRAEARAALDAMGCRGADLAVYREWHEELATRTLAVAVRDPADVSRPLAPLVDWEECEDDQIAALWKQYQDLEERLDPLGAEHAVLSDAEVAAMRDAAKKGDADLLMSYGSRRLALYAASTAVPPPTSPTPR
jgi:hypothetical protein